MSTRRRPADPWQGALPVAMPGTYGDPAAPGTLTTTAGEHFTTIQATIFDTED